MTPPITDSLQIGWFLLLQLDVLIQYVGEEASEAEAAQGMEAARRSIEARLPLVLRCCAAPHALLAAALAASRAHPLLLLLLYMKVSVIAARIKLGEKKSFKTETELNFCYDQ